MLLIINNLFYFQKTKNNFFIFNLR